MSEDSFDDDKLPRLTVTGGIIKDRINVYVMPHKIEDLTIGELSAVLLDMITELSAFYQLQLKLIRERENL